MDNVDAAKFFARVILTKTVFLSLCDTIFRSDDDGNFDDDYYFYDDDYSFDDDYGDYDDDDYSSDSSSIDRWSDDDRGKWEKMY